ncbi:DUF2461 domain-containing protein [Arcticibacter sp. MXS-1]|uniref:DUF2461 domain-containing protein n=1 Tax=Arcticibacter sp. MXS-1 TaxID=3341726 RepID=UPI0035A8C409
MLDPSTFSFLAALAANNNREWFLVHKPEYESARENVMAFTAELIKGISAFDPTVPDDLDPRDCVMRIYRDIRFSHDKTPYKTNFGVAVSANGKNFKGPGYYLHIQPGKSFIAGGAWFPQPDELKAIRQEIDYNLHDWTDIVQSADFVSAFGEPDQEGKLKTVPKGYASDHPGIDYLKLKSFTATRNIADKDLTKQDASLRLTGLFEKLYPFMVFLRNAIC